MEDTQLSKKYQPLFAVQDKRFNLAALSQYHLSIYINDIYVKICCVNAITKRCLLFEEYKLTHECAHQRLQAIEQLYKEHPILAAKDWFSVTLCVGNQRYTVIPKSLLQEKEYADYLSFACPIGSNTVEHFTHCALNAAVVFAIDSSLVDWFTNVYEKTRLHIIHQASCLIQGTWTYLQGKKPEKLPRVLVFVEANNLHITAIQNGNLIYYNRFAYDSCDELLYYTLIVMRTLQLDTSLHEVILGGYITKQSLAYKKARQYIRRLTLMNTLPYLRFGKTLPNKVMIAHLDILSAHLCFAEL